ncbi:MAG: SH3 domain-containing protein, partial [Treponema sp.]|nr:SH3 domain-containing protein [Candidatus Treponema scatequi]
MKKRILFVAAMFLMAACCFGQKFVAGGYAYVDASSGLRVRSDASLGARKIGVVYDRMKVKVIEVGPKVTIDGISSNWIRILLPVESIKERRTVSGWVFGGYLTEKLKPFSTDGWTDQDLILYMCRFEWRGERYLCNFKQTRECSCGLPESSFGGSGSYKVSMINKTVDMKFEFA